MPEQNEPRKNAKAEDAVKRRREPPEYRRFKRLLKQIIKAPPLRRLSENKTHID